MRAVAIVRHQIIIIISRTTTTTTATTTAVMSLSTPKDFEVGCSRKHQEWVFKRLPLTPEQYRDLCCGLAKDCYNNASQAMTDDDDDTTIDLTVPPAPKKRKK